MLETSAHSDTINALFTIPTHGHVTHVGAASSDHQSIFLRKILSVSHQSQRKKAESWDQQPRVFSFLRSEVRESSMELEGGK